MEHMDLYTERLGPDIWAEPLNVVSNIAFFAAALAAWFLTGKTHRRPVPAPLATLTILVAVVGTGSTLFHLFATRWSWFLDVVPIVVYQLTFFWFYMRKVAERGPVATLSILALVVAGAIAGLLLPYVAGSLFYAPAVLFLFGLGIFHLRAGKKGRFVMLNAAILFLVSVSFRTMDLAVGPYIPWGTHFLWHSLNGLVIYLGMRALIRNWAVDRN